MTVDYAFDPGSGIATLRLNRPEAGNALDLPTAETLRRAVRAAAAEPGLRAVHLTAAGPRFCVGGDVRAFAAQPAGATAYIGAVAEHLHRAVLGLAGLPAPVLTSVRGSAAGAGFALAMAGDVVLCSSDARFVLAYAGVGLTPDGGASWFLSRLVGYRRAAELTMLNPVVDAEQALAWGLVTRVHDDLDAAAAAELERLAAGPSRALARTRALLHGGPGNDLATHLDLERHALLSSTWTADGAEGIRAFAERRPARFTGI